MDSTGRTFVKALLWQVTGILCTVIIGLVLTGSAALGGKIALANAALGFALYAIYERLWARVRWGRADA
ncbi:DUF2061 domain-containing protein [Pseudoruegeria sp. SHC-113]|uniref:DUF2061 domain-containing protein n=1 Tax=Pseudoruegeria sp. SHC-113 TaxID=2855439 RepID=UPI0021BB2CE5|nr:DUF2061 domain-containing protein [Pseudoruegeria sp. SHC-113]MCT8159576.1 DUF2061 domain-containing protein [Pseudoruegeria sp. SHC-113]